MDNAQHVLTSIPVILEAVMDYLPILDLYRLQRVCKVWESCAKNKIAARERRPTTQLLTVTQRNDEEKFVSFKRGTRELLWKKNSEKYEQMREWKCNWMSLPQAGVCIYQTSLKKRAANFNADNILRYWLPPKSELLVLSTVGSVVCADPAYSADENMVEDVTEFYNFISFPSKPGSYSVEFLHLQAGHVENEHDNFIINAKRILDNPNTKLMFVCEEAYGNRTHPILHDNILVPAVRKGKVVIGSIFKGPIVFNADRRYADCKDKTSAQNVILMSFIGKNVLAASVLIDAKVDTTADFKTELEKLNSTVKEFSNNCREKCANRTTRGYCYACSSQTLAIMIACCARADGRDWYDHETPEGAERLQRNFEQDAFRSILPNIPLLGAYGLGELGASINLIGEKTGPVNCNDLLHGECTIFAVVVLR